MAESFPAPETIHAAAQAVLANNDYTLELYEPPYFSLIRDLVAWANHILQPLFDLLAKLFALPPHLKWPLLIFFTLLTALIVWQVVVALRAAFARRRLKEYQPAPKALPADAGHWLAEAERAAAAGDYLTALRLLFRSGILRLEGERFTRAATNREYLRRYRGTELEQPLRVLVQLIDYKWYGGRDCVSGDWESGQAAYKALLRAKGGSGSRPADTTVRGAAR